MQESLFSLGVWRFFQNPIFFKPFFLSVNRVNRSFLSTALDPQADVILSQSPEGFRPVFRFGWISRIARMC